MTFGYLAIASSGGSWGPSLLDLHQGLTCLRFNEPTECNLAMSQKLQFRQTNAVSKLISDASKTGIQTQTCSVITHAG